MTKQSDPAYPHLVTPGWEWTVKEVPQRDAAVGHAPEKPDYHELRVPRLVLPSDHLVLEHEATHILRSRRHGHWARTGHRVRDLMRKMIEEAAVETENLTRVDTRRARDDMDWEGMETEGEINAAKWYFQLRATLQPEDEGGTGCAALRTFFEDQVIAHLRPELLTKLEDAYAVIQEHWDDPVSLDELADFVTSRLVETEDPPAEPTSIGEMMDEPPTVCGYPMPSDDADDTGDSDMPTEAETGESDDDAEATAGDDDDAPTGADPGADSTASGDGGSPGETPEPGGTVPRPGDDTGDPGGTPSPARTGRPAPRFLEDFFAEEPVFPGLTDEAARDRAELEAEAKEAEASMTEAMRRAGEVSSHELLTGRSEFGLLDIHRHTMDRRAAQTFGLAWVPRDTGSQVRYPHRLYPTGRVFAVPAPGGTIIVDGSGSMSWHQASMEAAMEKFPNLTAVVYSMHTAHTGSRSRKGFGGFVAKVCIVAQGGRLGALPKPYYGMDPASACSGHSGGNGDADKATLDYAVKHWPKPWVWVSDGQVEAETTGNYPAVNLLMRRYRIPMVRQIEDAIAYLGGTSVQAKTSCYGHWAPMRRGGPFIITGSK